MLVSVNPFRDLGIYTDAVLDSYRGKNRLEMPPHVFAVAESAYYNMKAYNDNQCVIISGESGAGKTEAAKRIMQYIANVSGGADSSIQATKDMVLATNPLLESFGNAKTLRNNNSSRFGKYLQLQFNASGQPIGADITNYLLEKSRVVGQILNERNFHIFYQFTKGASAKYRQDYGIQGPETYAYTKDSKCFNVDGIDDLTEFQDTLNAMNIIGLKQQEQDEIFRILAAILWTGNISFKEDERSEKAVWANDKVQGTVDYLAYLLGVESDEIEAALTTRIITAGRGEEIRAEANPAQATATRDALAKALYYNLFDWIVERVNMSLKAKGTPANSIGILDIYGFEIFDKNSFEQLCINYVNEKLQQIFIQLTLKTEQEEYAREQIKWAPIKYFDNKVVCDLIEGTRPTGIFAAMKDASRTASADPAAADRTFMQSINGMSHAHLTPRQGNFIIKHYAGDVTYTVDGMTDKNKDQLLRGLLELFGKSQNRFVHTLFPHGVDADDRRQPPSAGDKIKASANDLVATLMKATPSYIRTIKPNENKSSTEYTEANVLHQIKYLGLQENVRIRRAGFAYRQTYHKFLERFALLSKHTAFGGEVTWTGDAKSGTQQILNDLQSIPKEEYQFGTTKIFIKSPETLFALEDLRDKWYVNIVTGIQRKWRRIFAKLQKAVLFVQRRRRVVKYGDQVNKIRDAGHQLLGGRKERRRMSLSGYRRFHGDYLGFNASIGPGALIRKTVNLPSSEKVIFSCAGETLESKFGRSSKESPRFLVLTKGTLYVICPAIAGAKQGMHIERSISLASVRAANLSICRDDWFSPQLGSASEADPLLNCVFKTELLTHMKVAKGAGNDLVKITPNISYAKKPGKMHDIKVVKDSQQRADYYKSGAVHTQQGEPATSLSKAKPKTKFEMEWKTRLASMPPPRQTQRQPAAQRRAVPAARPVSSQQSRPIPSHTRQPSTQQENHYSQPQPAARHVPPPPPPAPPPARAQSQKPTHRAMYDYDGSSTNTLSFSNGDVIDVKNKDGNNGKLSVSNLPSLES